MVPNGPNLGSCYNFYTGDVWDTCTEDAECWTNNPEWWIWCDNKQIDSDSDGPGEVCDNCPKNCNSQQLDHDGDGIGDVCDGPGTAGKGCSDGCGSPSCEQEC
jgi:hypothetical protein